MAVRALDATYWPAARWILTAIAIVAIALFAAYVGPKVLSTPGYSDAESYWMLNLDAPYASEAGSGGAFLYSPLVAQVLWPFTLLPREAFYALMLVVNLAALSYLLTPIGAALALLIPFVSEEVAQGNIHILLALALVVGVRHPGWFAAFPLTKVTPSVLFLWHRGRSLVVAVGTTVALVALSALVAPHLWIEWIERLAAGSTLERASFWTDWPLWFRLALAAVVVVLARWRDRPAALPFALLLSVPIPWFGSLSVLAAIPRLVQPRHREVVLLEARRQ